MTCIPRILLGILALLAVAGLGAAQSPCPECDEDGDGNADNTYHDVDVGAVENSTASEAVADTDASHGHHDDEKGFWAWLSVCLSAFLGHLEEALGIDADADAHADAYVSEDGVDVDASASALGESVGFDESPLGDLDGATWDVMSEANAVREDLPVEEPAAEIPDYEGVSVNVCVYADLGVVEC